MKKISILFRIPLPIWLAILSLLYLNISIVVKPVNELTEYWHFVLLGITAATFANSTGAGGGVVFIPAFQTLGFSSLQSLGTSLAIQCFGMSAGSIVWLSRLHKIEVLKLILKIVFISAAFSVFGILLTQYYLTKTTFDIEIAFKWFSIFFGIILLIRIIFFDNNAPLNTLTKADLFLIAILSFFGGIITAWISVGVGEILALYLIFRKFRIEYAVAAAVFVTAISVIFAVPFHISSVKSIDWLVVLFSASGAVIGGAIAPFIAHWLGGMRLKILISFWILIAGIAI